MDENESSTLASHAILKRMDDIVLSIREVRNGQITSDKAARDVELKLERVLGKIEELSRAAENQKLLERRLDGFDVRVALYEEKIKTPQYCVENAHEKRINVMERSHLRIVSGAVAVIILIQVGLWLAKELL